MDFDAGDFSLAGGDRQSHPLKQREVDVNVQGLRLEAGEAIGNGDKSLPQPLQILQPFVQAKIFHSVYTDLDPQKGAELLIHAPHHGLAVDPQHVMTVVEFFEYAVELAA